MNGTFYNGERAGADIRYPETTICEDSNGTKEISIRAQHIFNGRIFLEGTITQSTAVWFASVMRHLADEKKPADIYINSPGGEVNAGLLIYDIIRSYPCPIDIYCTGIAASMGAVLLAGGRKGRRFILPHSRVMIHEPLIAGGIGGSATTIEKTAQSILETKSLINGLLAENTGRTLEEINSATLFDNCMGAEEAVEFGLCDEIRSIFD